MICDLLFARATVCRVTYLHIREDQGQEEESRVLYCFRFTLVSLLLPYISHDAETEAAEMELNRMSCINRGCVVSTGCSL